MKALVLLLLLAGFAQGADTHDHDHEGKGAGRPRPGKGDARGEAGCNVQPGKLADFANGERYDFGAVVTFITQPACLQVNAQVSRSAVAEGVSFLSSGPYRLDHHAQSLSKSPGSGATSLDAVLGKSIPATFLEHPLTSSEMLPLLGQLALLSPTAARATLTRLIRQETESADLKMSVAKADLKPAIASDLAVSLLRMGVLDPVVASDLSEAVEDMALTVQADSLGKFFRGLAAAATADATLAPAFNLSATALNRGVQNGKPVLSDEQQAKLLQAVFEAVRASVAGTGLLEPGSTELNEAVGTLIEGKPLTLTGLRKLWRQANEVLARSPTQGALAEAVAASLTPQLVFLRPQMRELLLKAATNYPVLARAIQQNFVYAWHKAWSRMSHSEMSLAGFNRLRASYFEPMVPKILEFTPEAVDVRWMRAAYQWGLLKDEEVEKKIPRLFLALLDKRERTHRELANDPGPEGTMKALAEDFATVWSLYHVYLPVLNRWVKRHED